MEFTFNFCPTDPKPMCPVNISVGKEHCKSQHISYMLNMDQNLKQPDLCKNTADQVPLRETNGREKSNKCNQCDYASSRASHLRRHFKRHTGKKSN